MFLAHIQLDACDILFFSPKNAYHLIFGYTLKFQALPSIFRFQHHLSTWSRKKKKQKTSKNKKEKSQEK